MKELVRRVLQWREGGMVERCHFMPHHGSYSVAYHTHQMLVLLELLHPNPPKRLYRAILRHDLAERYVGDMPFATKKKFPEVDAQLSRAEEYVEKKMGCSSVDLDLSEDDRLWMKALDQLEFWLWCHDQVALGSLVVQERLEQMDRWIMSARRWYPKPCVSFIDAFEWSRTSDCD